MFNLFFLFLVISCMLAPSAGGPLRAAENSVPAAKTGAGATPAAATRTETKARAIRNGEAETTSQDPTMPDGLGISLLIRRTLLTLNDANLSGNYSVLRDLAAPSFLSANTAAKLGDIFANLRRRNLDLAPVMFFDPKLVREPQITEAGMLHLSGFIPTRPQQVNFDMMFEKISDRWRLFGIAVNASAPQGAAATPAKKATDRDPQAQSK